MAFLHGVYEGDCRFEELAKKGNFGLGTVNAVDGEMIAVDGKFYRVDAAGVASEIPADQTTPFAVVSEFQPVPAFEVRETPSLKALSELIDQCLPTKNIFYMIRIDGTFDWIRLRSERCQTQPYQPLAESLPKLQNEFELSHSVGTLAVSRCPAYSAGVTIPGYHYHYLDKQRTTGGHVFDLKVKSAQVMINPIRRFELLLQDHQAFDEADLNIDLNAALKQIE